MAFLLKRDRARLAVLGLEAYAHVPFLMNRDMTYATEANRFLRQRATGEWSPDHPERSTYHEARGLSTRALESYAADLKSFLSYCERRRLDWRTLSHVDLLSTYDKDMLSGKARRDGNHPLALSTINRRMLVTIQFLSWVARRGLRPSFTILSHERGASVSWRSRKRRSTEAQLTDARIGKHRVHPKRLRLPSVEALSAWLAEVRAVHGPVHYLRCGCVLEMGLRLEEVAGLRESQLPDPSMLDLNRPASMQIRFGVKGGRIPGDASLAGTPRTVGFRRKFLVELDAYRRLRRKKSLARFSEKYPDSPRPLQLFLNETTGKPFSAQSLYRVWTSVRNKPCDGWSPHLGRHTFACYLLLRLIQEEAARMQLALSTLPRSHIIARVEDLIRIYITPILGHVDEKTTELYVDWVAQHMFVAGHVASWSNYLEEDLR